MTWPPASMICCSAAINASSPRAQMASFTPSAASASAVARPNPFEAAVTRAVLPVMPRSMRSSAVHDDQPVVDVVERLRPLGAGDDDVLDARTVAARQVDPRFDRKGVPRGQRVAVAADDVRILVLLQPDAVAGAMDEVLAVAAVVDDAAGDGVDVLACRADPGGIDGSRL